MWIGNMIWEPNTFQIVVKYSIWNVFGSQIMDSTLLKRMFLLKHDVNDKTGEPIMNDEADGMNFLNEKKRVVRARLIRHK